mgnify:CR=1 FL=1
MNIPNRIILDLLRQIVKDVEHHNKIGSFGLEISGETYNKVRNILSVFGGTKP